MMGIGTAPEPLTAKRTASRHAVSVVTYQNDLSELSEHNLRSLILPHFQRQQRQALTPACVGHE